MTATVSDNWLVARTQPRRERWAAENVTRLHSEYYLPHTMEVERFLQAGVRRREFRIRPLFPTYLFVRPQHGQWHALLEAFGIAGLVPGAGGNPAVMRDSAIALIRSYEDSDGVVTLPKEIDGFHLRQPVRVTRGAYTGYTGLIDGLASKDRIQILLDYMGRKVPFLVSIPDLEAVA